MLEARRSNPGDAERIEVPRSLNARTFFQLVEDVDKQTVSWSDKALVEETDPKTPVDILRRRGENFLYLKTILGKGSIPEVPVDLVKEVVYLARQTEKYLKQKDYKKLEELLSPKIEVDGPNGTKRMERGNRYTLLRERYLP